MSNLKSVALTVLELLAFNSHRSAAHLDTDTPGDICNFVTAVSALSNTSQRSVYNYRRVGRYFALGNTCPVQLFLVNNENN